MLKKNLTTKDMQFQEKIKILENQMSQLTIDVNDKIDNHITSTNEILEA